MTPLLPFFCCCALDAPHAAQNSDRPNVIIISVDMLRPDHLGCYGYSRPTSPNIDRLAADGALFENAVSSTSWTLPAHAALFTGLADSVHGCTDTDTRLDDSRTTIAERLKARGYRTVGFFAGPYLHPVFGLAQGFDDYIDCTSYAADASHAAEKRGSVEGQKLMAASHADVTGPRTYDHVRAWLDAHVSFPGASPASRPASAESAAGDASPPPAPFFMFIHLWDVHFDFIPPPPFDRMFDPDYAGPVTGRNFFFDDSIHAGMPRRDLEHLIALYDGEIAWTDLHVGKILDQIDRLKLRDSTIVILLSDHGTEFFEHGAKAHRTTLFDESIRIPLIIRYPRRIAPATRVNRQAHITDVAASIIHWLSLPGADEVMGRPLIPSIPNDAPDDRLALSELDSVGRKLSSYRRLDGKLISDRRNGGTLVFDLLADPAEQRPLDRGSDLQKSLTRQVREFRALLARWRQRMPESASSQPAIPDEVLRQLKTHGYVGDAPTSLPADSQATNNFP